MTTSNPTSNPTSAHRPNAPTAYSAEGTQPARVAPRRGSETKAAFKTTEFIAYVVASSAYCSRPSSSVPLTRMRTTSGPIGHGSTLCC